MATDYLELNKEVLEKLKESDPVKYRSLKRYLECQNIYAETGDWSQAAAHWNAWAKNLLAERKKLEESGEWEVEKGLALDTVGKNQPTRDWLSFAKVDFSHVLFLMEEKENETGGQKDIDSEGQYSVVVKRPAFEGITFPSDIRFDRATLSGAVGFGGSEFNGDAWFWQTTFNGDVWFWQTTFNGDAWFLEVTFRGAALFLLSTFGSEARFWRSTFNDSAWFTNITFRNDAEYKGATFSGDAKFEGATFSGYANFCLAHFKKSANFTDARFRKAADFSSIHSEKSFSLLGARFRMAPDFNEAAFHAPPVLDAVHVGEQLTAKRGRWPFRFRHVPEPEQNAKDISRNFRALGKMAHEARDWLNEMEFFAQEIRAYRFGEDFPLGEYRVLRGFGWWLARKCHLRFLRSLVLKLRRKAKSSPWRGPNPGRFWFGLIYEKASNFGRSFARPLALWAVSTALFAALYAALASEWGGWNWWDALYLSVRHGLVVGGLVRTGHMQQVIEAMFGELGSALALLMMGQTILSAFFLFLFFLAVRNHFRIR